MLYEKYEKCKECGGSYLYGIHTCFAAYAKRQKPIYLAPLDPFIGPGTRSVDEYNRHIRPMNDRERGVVDQVMDAHALWVQPIRMGG